MFYKDKVEAKISREIQIIDPDLGKEEIKELIENPEQVQKLLESKILKTAHFTVVNAVEDIKEKYEDILTLEQVLFLHLVCRQSLTLLEYQADYQDHR